MLESYTKEREKCVFFICTFCMSERFKLHNEKIMQNKIELNLGRKSHNHEKIHLHCKKCLMGLSLDFSSEMQLWF